MPAAAGAAGVEVRTMPLAMNARDTTTPSAAPGEVVGPMTHPAMCGAVTVLMT